MIGRNKELTYLKNGISPGGTLRCACITGEAGIGKSILLDTLKEKNNNNSAYYIWIQPNLDTSHDVVSLISNMTRGMSHNLSSNKGGLLTFARNTGKEIAQFSTKNQVKKLDSNDLNKLSRFFIDNLTKSLIEIGISPKELTPILVFDGIDKVSKSILSWLSGEFNNALRNSQFFLNTRFLFTSEKYTDQISGFFSNFGFASPFEIKLAPFSTLECAKFAKLHSVNPQDTERLFINSKGNPSKLLKILKNTIILKKEDKIVSKKPITSSPSFSDFSEKELSYLLHASYPTRINRYNLEFFCSPRDAAFCFNWLKRQKSLTEIEPDGDLILNTEFRNQMREFHKQEEPEEAESMEQKATIIDAFTSLFPNPNQHWIPVNLQVFDSFTKGLCKALFTEIQYTDLINFLANREDVLNISNKQFSLNEDVKLISQRFIEIGGVQPFNDLAVRAKEEWLKYQEKSTEKRSRIEQEKTNLEDEAFDSEKQMIALEELKGQLVHNFKNPPKNKSRREYSFSTSLILVIIGLITVGLSLYSDSLGSYHAACGLAIAIFGFFWPNVEVKKQVLQTAGNSPRLAIETQQRSLSHRISGLSSRVSSIKSNLEDINTDLENLDQGISSPYIID